MRKLLFLENNGSFHDLLIQNVDKDNKRLNNKRWTSYDDKVTNVNKDKQNISCIMFDK